LEFQPLLTLNWLLRVAAGIATESCQKSKAFVYG